METNKLNMNKLKIVFEIVTDNMIYSQVETFGEILPEIKEAQENFTSPVLVQTYLVENNKMMPLSVYNLN